MAHSRREFLRTAASAATFAAVPTAQSQTIGSDAAVTPEQIVKLFENLPGDKSLKILAPSANGKPKFQAQLNSDRMLFVASAIKTLVLCERLRQIDSPDVVPRLEKTELALNASVWSPGSPTFNPPNVRGTVFERATMEAMITSSDNTATDMMFKLAGPENVRRFISSAGLTQTLVPESTRAFTAYVFGAENYKTISWLQLVKLVNNGTIVHPFLNDVETLASCPDDFVSYYSRALRGAFFKHRETLNEFRRILTLCDFIYLVPLATRCQCLCQERQRGCAGLPCSLDCWWTVLFQPMDLLCVRHQLVGRGVRRLEDCQPVFLRNPSISYAHYEFDVTHWSISLFSDVQLSWHDIPMSQVRRLVRRTDGVNLRQRL